MRPTFECQVITHRNEMVTGVLFKENGLNQWVCSRCIVDRNQEKKLDYMSFPQIIDQLEDEAHALKQYLVEQNKKIVSLITQFECLRKKCGQIISDYEKSIDLMNSEEFADPLVRQMIQGLKKKRPHEFKELATKYHLENKAISLWEIKQYFQELGTNLLRTGNSKLAIKYLRIEDSQDQDDEDFQSLINLGKCLTAKKKYQKALEYFDQSIIMDQNNFAPYFEKGIVLRKQQQYDQALLFLEKAKNKLTSPDEIPGSMEIDYQIGIILLKQKKIKEAFALFDVLIERNPVYEVPYFAKIKHLLQKQDLEQAILCCNSLLKKCESSKIGNFYRGLILLAKNEETMALESLQKVILMEHLQQISFTHGVQKMRCYGQNFSQIFGNNIPEKDSPSNNKNRVK